MTEISLWLKMILTEIFFLAQNYIDRKGIFEEAKRGFVTGEISLILYCSLYLQFFLSFHQIFIVARLLRGF